MSEQDQGETDGEATRDVAVDEKDIRVLMAIAEESTDSPERIHEITGIPTSTVHYRIQKLRESGVLQNDLYDIDVKKLGLSLTLVTEVWAEYEEDYHRTVGDRLSEVEGVNQVYFTMGDTDFVVVSHLANRAHVEDLISSFEAIDGITRTSSKFVITTVKNEPNPCNDFDLDTLIETLAD